MKYVVKNLIIEALSKPPMGKGERKFIPVGSPRLCWTTSTTCWCTCSGCTTLTHNGTAYCTTQISRYKDLEKDLVQAITELRRRQSLLQAEKTHLSKKRGARSSG